MTTRKSLSLALHNTLATLVTPFIAVACCGLGNFERDENLLVELKAPVEQSVDPDAPANEEDAAPPETLCGAQVVATDTDGDEIPLTEEVVDGRCRYRGQVNPFETYTIKATHPDFPELAAEDASGSSNPACNEATAPDETDSTLELVDAALVESGEDEDEDEDEDEGEGQSG
jgi:hypothetical protein